MPPELKCLMVVPSRIPSEFKQRLLIEDRDEVRCEPSSSTSAPTVSDVVRSPLMTRTISRPSKPKRSKNNYGVRDIVQAVALSEPHAETLTGYPKHEMFIGSYRQSLTMQKRHLIPPKQSR